MTRPDWCPQRVWNEACDARAMGGGGSVVEVIARAILSAEQRERKSCAEVVRKMIPSMPPDGPVSTEHQAEYEALGFAMTAIANRGTDND